MSKIIIIDDDVIVRQSLSLVLSEVYDVEVFCSGSQALDYFQDDRRESKGDELVLLDVMMPGIDGVSTLSKIKELDRDIPIIMLTASTSIKSAVEAMKLGAIDYVSKPFDVDALLELISVSLPNSKGSIQIDGDSKDLQFSLDYENDFGPLVGKTEVMESLYQKIQIASKEDINILIFGETGVGKALIAKVVHDKSERAGRPFTTVNCSSFDQKQLDNLLFGHSQDHQLRTVLGEDSVIADSDGGTIFFEEFDLIDKAIQLKLKNFLDGDYDLAQGQDRVDVRIICSTEKSQEQLIESKDLRSDFYYKVSSSKLFVPSLRDRYEDVPLLIDFFISKLSAVFSGRKIKFSKDALKKLQSYPWPGNISELENVIANIYSSTEAETIDLETLPEDILNNISSSPEIRKRAISGEISFEEAQKEFETELIINALEKTNYIQTKAAKLLGITRRILKYKMEKFDIKDKRKDD